MTQEGRLIQLPREGRAVFIGDTHGDFEATEKVFQFYFKPGYTLVFLGDYVDRGKHSRENIEFLLQKKLEAPKQLFLLMGNHEGYPILPFSPADFWESLSPEENVTFSEICRLLPFMAVTENSLMAVHGVPPDIKELEEVNEIPLGSEFWQQATWGDFTERSGEFLGGIWGRPLFGKDYFKRTMKQLKMNVLIRAHQPHIEPIIFEKHCLTLITSHAYKPVRNIAIVDLETPVIKTTDDLEVLEI